MQEDTSGGKRQQIVGLGSEETLSNLEKLSSALQQEANAKINKAQNDANQKIQTQESVKNFALTGAKILNKKADEAQKNMLSALEIESDKRALEVQNQIADGGEIDKMEISQEEKMQKKLQAIQSYTAIEELQLEADFSGGFLGKFASDKTKLSFYKQDKANKLQQQKQAFERSIENSYQKQLTSQTKNNLKQMIVDMGKANDENTLYSTLDITINSIEKAYDSGYIDNIEREQYTALARSEADDKAIDVIINNARDLVLRGRLVEALSNLENTYETLRQGNDYLNSNDRIANETKVRNEIQGISKKLDEGYIENLLSTVDYSRSSLENKDYITQATANQTPKVQQEAMTKYTERQQEYNKQPIDFYNRLKPNATVEEKQIWLNKIGMGEKTILDKNSKVIESIQNDFTRIGNLRNADNKPFNSLAEEFNVIYQGIEKNFIIPPKPYETESETLERVNRQNQLILKEIKIHGTGMDYLMVQARIEDRVDLLNDLIKIKVQQNKPEGFIGKGKYKEKEVSSLSLNAIQYERIKDPKGYNKIEQAILDYANYYNKSPTNVVKTLYENNDYIVNEKTNIKIDKSQYKKNEIEGRIAILKQYPIDYLKQQNLISSDADTFIGKYDLKANLYIKDDGANNLTLILQDQKGNKDELGTITIDELPPLKWIPTYKFTKSTTAVNEKPQQEQGGKTLTFEDFKNLFIIK